MADVRQNWRRLINYSPASGGYRGLHADAKTLLERIRAAQSRAACLARENRGRKQKAEEARVRAAEEAKLAARRGPARLASPFSALDGLRLN